MPSPRMELIDAVDADANGRGDLLFRQYSDIGISYGLYRVSPYQIEKIFEGGSSLIAPGYNHFHRCGLRFIL